MKLLIVFFVINIFSINCQADDMPKGLLTKLIGKQPIRFTALINDQLYYDQKEIVIKGFYDRKSSYLYQNMEAYYMKSTDRIFLNISAYKNFKNIDILDLCHVELLGRYHQPKSKYNEQLIGTFDLEYSFFAAGQIPKDIYKNFNPQCHIYDKK